jgi:hypothetical protein
VLPIGVQAVDQIVFAISCCSCFVGRHGRVRADGEEVTDGRRIGGRSTVTAIFLGGRAPPPFSISYWYSK